MNESQRTKQMQAIHIQYARLLASGVLPPLHAEGGESCHLWATQALGRLISSLKACSDFELNALRDTLSGKPPKVHARLRDLLSRTKHDPDSYANYLMQNVLTYARYRESDKRYTVETIPLVDAYKMLKQEECRAGAQGYRKPQWQPVAQVKTEQRMLWGM